MNDFGNLAYYIIRDGFKDEVARFPVSYISGWLESNLGILSALTHQDFYIDENNNIGPRSLTLEEQAIYTKLYNINFYQKSARDAMRGVVWSADGQATEDWTSIKEGDSSIQRQSRTSISRYLSQMAKDEEVSLNQLLYQYNSNLSGPHQVAGEDGD